MSRVALLVITDGRPYLQQTLASAEKYLLPYIDGPTFLATDLAHEKGLSGNIRYGWDRLAFVEDWRDDNYVFHLEDDWVFKTPVPVDEMVALLERESLTQVALKRDAVNPYEQAVGGFMEANPHNYTDRGDWTESRFGFTFNPCLYKWDTILAYIDEPWEGEAGLTALMAGERFGIYGGINDPPRCLHIGHTRSAGWKL